MNDWEILFSKGSLKFLRKNHIGEDIITGVIKLAIRKFSGENINVDLKKLGPPYDGHFRIRVGRLRVTFAINFDNRIVEVAEINWRGSAYR